MEYYSHCPQILKTIEEEYSLYHRRENSKVTHVEVNVIISQEFLMQHRKVYATTWNHLYRVSLNVEIGCIYIISTCSM
jgi:hypothetical protein